MDPNETLRQLRNAVRYFERPQSERLLTDDELLDEITERFRALDEWLSKGGFKPEAWTVHA